MIDAVCAPGIAARRASLKPMVLLIDTDSRFLAGTQSAMMDAGCLVLAALGVDEAGALMAELEDQLAALVVSLRVYRDRGAGFVQRVRQMSPGTALILVTPDALALLPRGLPPGASIVARDGAADTLIGLLALMVSSPAR